MHNGRMTNIQKGKAKILCSKTEKKEDSQFLEAMNGGLDKEG